MHLRNVVFLNKTALFSANSQKENQALLFPCVVGRLSPYIRSPSAHVEGAGHHPRSMFRMSQRWARFWPLCLAQREQNGALPRKTRPVCVPNAGRELETEVSFNNEQLLLTGLGVASIFRGPLGSPLPSVLEN